MCWTDAQNQTADKTSVKMLARYSGDVVDGDIPAEAPSVDRFTGDQHATHLGAGRTTAAERHTQIF